MKHKIFTKISIFAILFLCLTSYSQTSEDKPKINKKDKQEIEKFADEFMKDLKLTNDISQVSEKFFVGDFRTRLAKNNSLNLLFDNEELKAQISDSDLYYSKVAFINFLNLQTMFASKNYKPSEDDDDSESGDFLKKSLPPHIVELMMRSKWLRILFDEEDDEDNEDKKMTIEDVHSWTADLNTVSDAMRVEINSRKMTFAKKTERTKYYQGEPCEDEKCFGLPENTVIFAIHKYMMCLRIVRIDNELKIVELFSVADED